jgi:hypothetical protein
MNQKCYLCGRADAQTIERPNGYDGNLIICPSCTHYEMDRNAVRKLLQGHKVPDSLRKKAKEHFEMTGEPCKIGTVDLDIG